MPLLVHFCSGRLADLVAGGWMEDIRKVVGFDSVEEFWGLYNNIVPPSQLPGKANYYLFRVGVSRHVQGNCADYSE